MEMAIQLLILLTFFFAIFTSLKHIRKSTPNLPPGPWKLPLIGNMHNLIGDMPHRALHQLAQKYGPLMHLQLGEVSAVIVSSPEAAKQVMKTQDLNFASRPSIMAAEIMSYGCTSITFGPYGDYWRQLRKICTLELLSVKRVQSFQSIREQVCSDMVKWMASNEGSPINFKEVVDKLTYAVATRAALGKKSSKKQERFLVALKEAMKLGAGFDIADLYPSISMLQKMSGMRKKLLRLHQVADEVLEDIIREHKVSNATGKTDDGKSQEPEDLVDVLLKFQGDELEIPLTTENIKSVVVDMLAAGSDTSATTLGWVMAEMLKNPRIMEEAQKEVRQVYDKKGYVDESLLHELKYLKLIIKETFRMHPSGPLLLPRKCIKTCEIDGYVIPIDTKIIVNAWAINRDPAYWKEPDCFRPERFLDSLVDYKGNHFELIPFGAGRRMCPGISFGVANVELPIATFLYHFDWSLTNGVKPEEMDMTESFGVTTSVKELVVTAVVKRPLMPRD